jgi:hypothetical protein
MFVNTVTDVATLYEGKFRVYFIQAKEKDSL